MEPLLATAELTVNQWGIVAIGIVSLIAPAMSVANFVFGRLDKKREEERVAREAERIAREEAEPRHTPGVDQKIRAETSAAEERLRADIAKVEAKHEEDNRQLHGRISKMRDETKADWDRTAAAITRSVERIADKVDKVTGSVDQMSGEMRQMNQQMHVTDQALRQHIKDDK